ncbi:MAG: GNAT family N-acetyltransferase [Micrococcaceae bacterium]
MTYFALKTQRFVLDLPTVSDVDDITEYCSDLVFEAFMTTPWPYQRKDAEWFVNEYVPAGWTNDSEWTWAIREEEAAPLLGVIGVGLEQGSVGFWLGAPHRGRGIMPEALDAVVDAVFTRTEREKVIWECVVGNYGSMRVAQKAGFRFTGEGVSELPARDGGPENVWMAELLRSDDRKPKEGWPA